jgi:hypothetical protein
MVKLIIFNKINNSLLIINQLKLIYKMDKISLSIY